MLLFSNDTVFGQFFFKEKPENFKLQKLSFNSKENDYCIYPYGKGFVFSSSRKNNIGLGYYSSSNGKNFTDLYYTEICESGEWRKPQLFSKILKSKLNEGPVSFNTDQSIIYYTINVTSNKDEADGDRNAKLKIFKAELVNNKWTKIEGLPFNSNKYSVGHPAISPDNKKLYFASDMPGGYGGADLYVSYFHHGAWSRPVNLGPKVNTKGNELFPYINGKGLLFFSSDGHTGFGMLDVFCASFLDSEWKNVKNLGRPINSDHDDFGFITDHNLDNGFFSSNRTEGKDDNIYKFEILKSNCDSLEERNFCFTFFEAGTFHNESLPLAYEWDLGDGTKKGGLEVNHCFASPGEYNVQLNIVDSVSKQIYFNEATYKITIDEIVKPYIEVSGNYNINTPVEFEGRKSKLKNCKIKELIWDFGDGVKAIGPNVSHKFISSGYYEVSLLVRGETLDSLKNECESCVFKTIFITSDSIAFPKKNKIDTVQKIGDIAETVYSIKDKENVTYKVQLTTSPTPIPLESEKFKGIKNIDEYQEKGVYSYVVGAEKDLASAYPLYTDIKEKGFEEAQVVAFQNGKMLHKGDTIQTNIDGMSFTLINGRVITRFGEPLYANIIVENLQTGEEILRIKSDSLNGNFSFKVLNNTLYGFYAVLDSFYSVSSNFIDLRGEKRNLEIKKNIELIAFNELNEENISLRINNLFFEKDQYILSKESFPELKRLALLLKETSFEKNFKLEISGHTDNQGEASYNIELSQKRADAVKEYLIKLGCKNESIISKGFGFSRPLVSNNTERGRYFNRRVEFKFIR